MIDTIDSFQGEHRWLSNFWPCNIRYYGWNLPSAEHAYVLRKCCNRNDIYEVSQMTPGQAKRWGRLQPMHPTWEERKTDEMYQILKLKFGPDNPKLMQKLKDTGDIYLVEGNTWGDTFWGQCNGKGSNHLGKLLMKVRSEL